ncbi:hypothetical protein GCM10028774_52820 [Spirosoma jeollabukense]
MSVGTATNHCSCVIEALDWLRSQYLIIVNPVAEVELARNPTKEVYFLEPQHIDRLFAINPEPRYKNSLWWFKLICLTGMDLPDAVRYAYNRERYEARTLAGKLKIVIRRDKPPKNECNIPVLPRLVELWAEVNGKPPRLVTGPTLRNHLKVIQKLIGFDKPLTPKIGRKTAGMIFLEKYSIKAVSGILGHSSINTTERHYVKIRGSYIDQEMDLIG